MMNYFSDVTLRLSLALADGTLSRMSGTMFFSLLAFIVINGILEKIGSEKLRFDMLLLIAGCLLFVSFAMIGKIPYVGNLYRYLLNAYLIGVLSACALGCSLVCYRIRPDWGCQKFRLAIMYLFILCSVILLMEQYYLFSQKY